ncbi:MULTISPECIES: hypothetical protein [Streptomyces]|uniref:Uncharacterized protein n=2 Tax=Streptomyces TaxID=1883 RepID=A0A2U9P793_STRAS|nr:hypothetical protein [Streptomyces actuosus]AWT44965.1 hypothetical protein DMT42_23505 [Streptomyces actuosus]MBM4821523.1 hypothetical protein [Streptomyces actuosus]
MSGRAGRPGAKRAYVAVVCAVLLVAGVAGAVVALRGDGAGRPASRPAAAPTPTDKDTPDPNGVLSFRDAPPDTFYLPRTVGSDDPDDAPPYPFSLLAAAASGPRGRGAVKDVTVDFDLTALRGLADIAWNEPQHRCALSGYRVTCDLRTITYGETVSFDRPFRVRPRPGLALGGAGTVGVTVRAANAATLRHTTRVVVGWPYLAAGPDRTAARVAPGSEVSLTPAFANRGDTDVAGGVTLAVSVERVPYPEQQSFLRTRYGNCRYDKPVDATKALCAFPGPLRAGEAFETDGPFTATVGAQAQTGQLSYRVVRSDDVPVYDTLPDTAVRGTGPPLGLKPAAPGEKFTGGGRPVGRWGYASLDFRTPVVHDARAAGFAIRGRVGQVLTVELPHPRGAPGLDGSDMTVEGVTLPEGVSLVPFGPEGTGKVSEYSACAYQPSPEGPITCPMLSYGAALLRVRIDERVDGARGTVRVRTWPDDADRTNDAAPILVEYTS